MTRQLRPVIAKPVPKPFTPAEREAIAAYLAKQAVTRIEPFSLDESLKRAVPRRVRK
jgi:hypothetical protein